MPSRLREDVPAPASVGSGGGRGGRGAAAAAPPAAARAAGPGTGVDGGRLRRRGVVGHGAVPSGRAVRSGRAVGRLRAGGGTGGHVAGGPRRSRPDPPTPAARPRRGLVAVGSARATRLAAAGAWPVAAAAPAASATGPPAEVLLPRGGQPGAGPLGLRQLPGHVGGDVEVGV